MVLNISEIRKYLLLFWIITTSGVWTINVPSSLIIFVNFSLTIYMLFFLFNKGILRNAVTFSLFVVLLSCTFLLNFDLSAWTSYSFILCFCIIGMYISFFWQKGEFLDKYTKIILIVAVISLIMYTFRGFLATHQSGLQVVKGQAISYTNFYIYLYCRELPNRNCAIFWEPGAFAVFLGIALYNVLVSDKENKMFKLLILIVTLFTTQSTLAYTVILFALLLFLLNRNNEMNFCLKIIASFILIAIILMVMNEMGIFENIQEKLFTGIQTNASSKARNVAQMIDIKIISNSPLIGIGFKKYLDTVYSIGMMFGQKWTMAANTFTFMGAIFGIPFVSIPIIGLCKLCPKNSSRIFKLISGCFWIWLFATQNFAQKPIFYCLVFLGFTFRAFDEVEVKKNE